MIISQTDPTTISTLESKIAASRLKLMELWDARGITDADVLAASIEFDELINQYQQLNTKLHSIMY